MSNFIVLYDACVLYPASLRSLLMYLAKTGLFRAKWSSEIHREWMDNLLRNRPDLDLEKLERTRALMDANVDDCLVTGYQDLIQGLDLPDPNDRHVLAAAIRCKADMIVTLNLKDFPAACLAQYNIEVQDPDSFLMIQLGKSLPLVCSAVRDHRRSYKNPPKSVEEYLDTLEAQGLPQTVAILRDLSSLID